MAPDIVGRLWNSYLQREINTTIHANDRMYTTGQDWYWSVGKSAAQAIVGALATAPLEEVRTALDFGCGYGRVFRHVKALLPEADLMVCERNAEAADWCAKVFGAKVVSEENLPANVDLIWVGSVFTHLNAEVMQHLFDKLVRILSKRGVLVVTSHGRRAFHVQSRAPYIGSAKFASISQSYWDTGFGYASYDIEELGDYGVSMMSPSFVFSMGARHESIRLLTYHEAGWANHQDVFAWTKWPLSQ